MFSEDDYLNSDDPHAVSASKDGCVWAGCLYERRSGGFDLFYDHANSEFKPLDVGTITTLRHLSIDEGGVVFIARLDWRKVDKELLEEAQAQLLAWIAQRVH